MGHLFSYVPLERIKTLSCGHVIPVENLIAWPISKGPGGQEFEFTFEKRNSEIMVRHYAHQEVVSQANEG